MSSRFSQTSSLTKVIIIVEFFLVAYLLFSLTKNFYNSYQVDKYIAAFEEENLQLELENQKKLEDYLYYTSDEYMDKIAKQNLGLVNPGEKVIILSENTYENSNSEIYEDEHDFAVEEEKNNPQLWWDFFFVDY